MRRMARSSDTAIAIFKNKTGGARPSAARFSSEQSERYRARPPVPAPAVACRYALRPHSWVKPAHGSKQLERQNHARRCAIM